MSLPRSHTQADRAEAMSFLVIFLIFLFLERKSQRQMGLERSESPHLSAGLTGSVPKLLFDIYVSLRLL
jgi:hypothetical protein